MFLVSPRFRRDKYKILLRDGCLHLPSKVSTPTPTDRGTIASKLNSVFSFYVFHAFFRPEMLSNKQSITVFAAPFKSGFYFFFAVLVIPSATVNLHASAPRSLGLRTGFVFRLVLRSERSHSDFRTHPAPRLIATAFQGSNCTIISIDV